MTYVRLLHDSAPVWGIADGGVIRIPERSGTLAELLSAGADSGAAVKTPLADARLLAPLDDTAKVLCVGLNYRDHILEMGRELPERPVVFPRFPDSLVGPGEPLRLPVESEQFDYEAELAVVIGRGGRRIPREEALGHVLGYTVLNDGSLRDYQFHTHQYTPGKNFEASGAIGPWIVPADQVGPLDDLRISTRVDGELLQEARLSQLVFGVAELIEYVSRWTPLRPGDVIATGTPGGVGSSREPRRWLRAGERCEVAVERIGTLANPVVADRVEALAG